MQNIVVNVKILIGQQSAEEEMFLKNYKAGQLRNLSIIGHGGAGKTSLADAMLYASGMINRLGKVDAGTSTMDYDSEEVKRTISINAALAPCEWKGQKINLIDTPGFFDFVGEVHSALGVSDGALVVVCAASGVEVGTEQVWDYAEEGSLPRVIFVNKMERENADFYKTLDALRDNFGMSVVPLVLPIGSQGSFRGVVDLVKDKAYIYKGEGAAPEETDVPADMADEVEKYKEMLLEAVAETDDELTEKYLEGEELTVEDIEKGLKLGTHEGLIIPVLCGSATKVMAIDRLLDAILEFIPSPLEARSIEAKKVKSEEKVVLSPEDKALSAFVFKTISDPYVGRLSLFRVYSGTLKSDSNIYNSTKDSSERIGQLFIMNGKEQIPVNQISAGDIGAVAKLQNTGTGDTFCDKDNAVLFKLITFPQPVLTLAAVPKAKGDEDKINAGLARLLEEDPTFKIEKNAETGQLLISGMGELHLEVIGSRLAKKFGAEMVLVEPKIPYRETIRGSVEVEGKHKKQSGGRGQYGHVWLRLEPAAGDDFEFVDAIVGGVVPRQYIPAVEKGIREALDEGVLTGYPVVGLKATLYDGSYHSVDSSEMAFKIAGSMAFKKGMLDAKPVLLEPIMKVEVMVPEEYMGDIIGDLNKKRGRILGMEPMGNKEKIIATAPMSEMLKYAIDLRSMTQGRGTYTMEFERYEEVPGNISEQVIAAVKAAKEE